MTTLSLSLDAHVIQDLLRLQYAELDRLRSQLREAEKTSNDLSNQMVMGQEEVRVSEVERQTASDALAAAQGVIRRLRADKDALRTDVERMREDLTAAEASRATLIGQVAAAQKIIKNLNVGLTRERSVSLPPEVTAGSSADHALSPPRSARTSPAKGKGPSREPTAESPPMPPFHSSSISAQGSRIIPHSVISSRSNDRDKTPTAAGPSSRKPAAAHHRGSSQQRSPPRGSPGESVTPTNGSSSRSRHKRKSSTQTQPQERPAKTPRTLTASDNSPPRRSSRISESQSTVSQRSLQAEHPFMTILARNTLQQELQDVKHSLESADQSQLKASTHRQMATMFSRLSSFVAESSTPSASTLPDIWTSLTKAHTRAATRDMMTRVLRYDIMIGTWKAWRFLETECRQHCARALSASGSSSPWMRMLSTRIERYLQSAQPGSTLRLNSEEYVPIRNADPVVVEVLPCKQTLSDGELNTRVENEVVGILALWLQYPDSSQRSMPWRLQGPFINLLITLSGTQNVCYLTETWKAFTNVKASVFGDPNVRKVTKKHWDGLQKKAVPIAAAFRDSAGRKTLDEIQEVVGRFGGGGLKQEEYE